MNGVEEYIIIDPDQEAFFIYERSGAHVALLQDTELWQSPSAKIWLAGEEGKLKAYQPDKSPFKSYEDIQSENQQLQQ